jgi:transcriptional regulator with PAS, ATPase and Fis domain
MENKEQFTAGEMESAKMPGWARAEKLRKNPLELPIECNRLKEPSPSLEKKVQDLTKKLSEASEALREEVITRQQKEEALLESEEKYRNILGSIEDGYYEVDLAGNLTLFNDALCRMTGYSPAELRGTSMRCRHLPSDKDECPGSISLCPYIKGKEECLTSGGSTFSLSLPMKRP